MSVDRLKMKVIFGRFNGNKGKLGRYGCSRTCQSFSFAKWMETVRMMYFSEIGMMNLYDDSIGPILIG